MCGLSTISKTAFGCGKISEGAINFIVNYQYNQVQITGNNLFEFKNCQNFGEEIFVVTTQPVFTNLAFNALTSATTQFPEDKCRIVNSPFLVSNPQQTKQDLFFQDNAFMLNKCLGFEITDEKTPLDYIDRESCQATKITDNKYRASGPKCFFAIKKTSAFKVTYFMQPKCQQRDFFIAHEDAYPTDINASLGFYRLDDFIPGNPEYNLLGSINAKVSFQPGSDILPVSKYFGSKTALWPTIAGADVDFGAISLRKDTFSEIPSFFIRLPLLVNNNCPATCQNNICASPCNFYTPIVAQISIKKKRPHDRNYRVLDSWYQGNIVPGRFLGRLDFGRDVNYHKLETNDQIMVTAKFSSPSISYRILQDKAKQLMVKLRTWAISSSGVGSRALRGLSGELRTLGIEAELPNIGGSSGINTPGAEKLNQVLQILENIVGTSETWPPYYTKVCVAQTCAKAKHNFLTINMLFTIEQISSSGKITIGNIKIIRKSKAFGDAVKENVTLPTIKCSEDITYTQHIEPLLVKHCLRCHGINSVYGDFTSYENVFTQRIGIFNRSSVMQDMPPNGEKLTEEEKGLISQWVQTGALK